MLYEKTQREAQTFLWNGLMTIGMSVLECIIHRSWLSLELRPKRNAFCQIASRRCTVSHADGRGSRDGFRHLLQLPECIAYVTHI